MGRTDDMLIIRGVNVFPTQIEEILIQMEETQPHYQIIVDRGVKHLDEVEALANEILGMTLVTHQTTAEGKLVQKLYIEDGADIQSEFYLSVVLDRKLEMPLIMASTEGGMNIEDVAENTPEKIITIPVDPAIGFQGFHGRQLAFGLGLTDPTEQKILFHSRKNYINSIWKMTLK